MRKGTLYATYLAPVFGSIFKSRCIFLMLIGQFVAMSAGAQPDTDTERNSTNTQIWIDLYPNFFKSERWEYIGDTGYRSIFGGESWNRVHLRPSLRYHLNSTWKLRGGIGVFYVFNSARDRFEISPWQGVQLNWPRWPALRFRHFLRIEERMSFLTKNWAASFDFRLRYRLRGTLRFCKNCDRRFWFTTFYGELFFPIFDDVKEVFRNRGRIGVGLGRDHTKVWRWELLVNWQSSRVGPQDQLPVSDVIFQLKLRKRFRR